MADNRMPSMLALLGLLAVAGYQNRDKISEALKGLQARTAGPDGTLAQDGLSGILGSLGDLFGGGGTAGGMTAGQTAGQTAAEDGDVDRSFGVLVHDRVRVVLRRAGAPPP